MQSRFLSCYFHLPKLRWWSMAPADEQQAVQIVERARIVDEGGWVTCQFLRTWVTTGLSAVTSPPAMGLRVRSVRGLP